MPTVGAVARFQTGTWGAELSGHSGNGCPRAQLSKVRIKRMTSAWPFPVTRSCRSPANPMPAHPVTKPGAYWRSTSSQRMPAGSVPCTSAFPTVNKRSFSAPKKSAHSVRREGSPGMTERVVAPGSGSQRVSSSRTLPFPPPHARTTVHPSPICLGHTTCGGESAPTTSMWAGVHGSATGSRPWR